MKYSFFEIEISARLLLYISSYFLSILFSSYSWSITAFFFMFFSSLRPIFYFSSLFWGDLEIDLKILLSEFSLDKIMLFCRNLRV